MLACKGLLQKFQSHFGTQIELSAWLVSTCQVSTININQIWDKPSTGAFSGIAGCTPSIASQWQKTAVSRGAFGNGASMTYK